MKFRNPLLAVLAAVSLIGLSACDQKVPEEDTLPITPEALPDPSGMGRGNGFGPGQWNSGANDAAIGRGDSNVDADGWRVVDPGNNLGMPVIYFRYDSDELVESERQNLDNIAEYLAKPSSSSLGLLIEGHCDQRGTEEYNRALGERRANAIRAYLESKGLASNRIKTVSYGKDKPAVEGSGDEIWKQNRRGVPVPMAMPAR